MSPSNSPGSMAQQTLPINPPPPQAWYIQLLPYLKWVGILLLCYLIGPPVMMYALAMQEHAAGPSWQAEKRWAKVNGSAVLSLLWYVPIAFFHAPLASFWSSIFVFFANILHMPFLAWFGGTTIWPPLPSSLLLRWLLAFPLAGLLTIVIEAIKPQTTWETKRIVSPDEQLQLAAAVAAQEKKKTRAAQQSSTTQANTTPPATKSKPRTPAKPKGTQTTHTPKADSLWGGIDWQSVPETDPLKQEARREAALLDAKRREEARARWLAEQQAAFSKTTDTPVAPSSIVDSTLTPPPAGSTASSSEDKEDAYNWDEGEGSIQE